MKCLRLTPLLLALLAGFIGVGCGSNTSMRDTFTKKEYHVPQNFHQDTPWLPDNIRRVAVLPVDTGHADEMSATALGNLDGFVSDAVSRTEMFEVVRVTPKQMKSLTGRRNWSVDDPLPPDFFKSLNDRLQCDAVLFSELTVFKPYRPVAMGWKLHLIDSHKPHIWWASDLVFDSGDPAVANSAIKFSRENLGSGDKGASPEAILLSPTQFGRYALAASLGTLQGRAKN